MDGLTNLVDVVSMLLDTLQSMHGSMTMLLHSFYE